MHTTYGGKTAPCECVLKAVFRACYRRFQDCSSNRRPRLLPLEGNTSRPSRPTSTFKNEEYSADFCSVSRRSLTNEEYEIFRFRYLLGADYNDCCRRLNMAPAEFFRAVYRIEEKLGRIFRELEPHSLYPLDEYFSEGRSDIARRVA